MYKLYIAILFFFIQTISAQQLRQPFDFPILLSGNFCLLYTSDAADE